MNLLTIDYALIIGYFVLIFGIAIYSSREQGDQSEDYFLAGKNLGWFLVGSSIFASNIGSEHLIGLAGSGASNGVPVAQFEILAGFALILLGWLFAPFYLKTSVVTMPEFLEKRYSVQAREYLTFISVVGYVLTKISVTIYAGAIVFETIGVPFWSGAAIVVIATGIYTVFGGLRAVIYTDMIQMFIMLIGSILITYYGIDQLGTWQEVKLSVSPSFMSLWRSANHPEFPWTGILFGAPILGIWYWCTDQFVVQRVLAAKNISQARKGTLFAGYLKMLPLFLFVIPGIICAALANAGMLTLDNPDKALPTLAAFALPNGAKGIFVAGLLAALMSSLSSVFNSCSTLVTYEYFKRRNPSASEKKLVNFGRISTGFLVVLGLAWIPLMKYISGQLFTYIQSVQAYIAPPIAAVFLLGVLSKKINAKGCLAALYSGFVLGIARLALEINQESLSGVLLDFVKINFLMFALYLFIFNSILALVVSYFTEDGKNIDHLVLKKGDIKEGDLSDKLLTIGLVGTILFIWWYFS